MGHIREMRFVKEAKSSIYLFEVLSLCNFHPGVLCQPFGRHQAQLVQESGDESSRTSDLWTSGSHF